MFFSLNNYLNFLKTDISIKPIDFKITFNDYYKYNFISAYFNTDNNDLTNNFNKNYFTKSSLIFYPKRVGFLTKRIAM